MHHAHRTAPARAATVLVLALVLALVLLTTTGLVAPATLAVSARADAALLSEGRPALGLTRRSAEFPARDAVDGNPETRWASLPEDPQWLRVDLEQAAGVQRVEIVWGAAYSTAYSIQISNDGEVWSTQWSTDKGDGGTDTITVPGDRRGRYVRMRSGTRNGSAGIAVREMRVYGLEENEDPVETGIPAPAPGVSPKPSSNPNPTPTPTSTPPAPTASLPPTATGTTIPTPPTRPSPSPSRSGSPKDASGAGSPSPERKSSPSPSSSPSGQADAVRGAREVAVVGPVVPILYAVGLVAGLVALGIWLGRRLQRGGE